jgi:hypothetical protein
MSYGRAYRRRLEENAMPDSEALKREAKEAKETGEKKSAKLSEAADKAKQSEDAKKEATEQ